jgi:hypothetical protein
MTPESKVEFELFAEDDSSFYLGTHVIQHLIHGLINIVSDFILAFIVDVKTTFYPCVSLCSPITDRPRRKYIIFSGNLL